MIDTDEYEVVSLLLDTDEYEVVSRLTDTDEYRRLHLDWYRLKRELIGVRHLLHVHCL